MKNTNITNNINKQKQQLLSTRIQKLLGIIALKTDELFQLNGTNSIIT